MEVYVILESTYEDDYKHECGSGFESRIHGKGYKNSEDAEKKLRKLEMEYMDEYFHNYISKDDEVYERYKKYITEEYYTYKYKGKEYGGYKCDINFDKMTSDDYETFLELSTKGEYVENVIEWEIVRISVVV